MTRPKPLDQLSPAYRRRIERGLAAGLSRSQARGHPRTDRGERSVSDIRREAKLTGTPIQHVAKTGLPPGTYQSRVGDTTYLHLGPQTTTLQIMDWIASRRQAGDLAIRFIFEITQGGKKIRQSSYWIANNIANIQDMIAMIERDGLWYKGVYFPPSSLVLVGSA